MSAKFVCHGGGVTYVRVRQVSYLPILGPLLSCVVDDVDPSVVVLVS